LLDTEGEGISKFALNVFRKLFTLDERKQGIIEIPEKTNKSKRVLLDKERIDILKRCIEVRFSVAADKKMRTWAKMRKVCNRHCYDISSTANNAE
jgi:hypothetical protein